MASFVSLVTDKIGELLVKEAKLLCSVKDEVGSLQSELKMMNAFLKDTDAMDEEGVDERTRTTIAEMRKIAYDAEDVIESYIHEASFSADVAEGFIKSFAGFKRAKVTHQIGSEIESIKERIDRILEMWKEYVGQSAVITTNAGARMSRGRWRRKLAYPFTHEEHVVGLEEDINKLVAMLTTTDGTNIQVLSVVGMGGSGKTTLARKLYNHESIKTHFDCIAWVSVSQDWVAEQILLELLKTTSRETMGRGEAWSLQELAVKLHQYLERKTYLIVLDDVWEIEALEQIIPAFPLVNDGRKIIITTRKQEVVDFPDLKCSIHEPRRLTEEESWELFRKIALIHREHNSNYVEIDVLETLGKEMLKKCRGLPLAVIALAGILAKKETLEEWEKVKKAVSSRIMNEGKGTRLYGPVEEMLTLSYNDLNRELKPCFLYLAMFQEDSLISTGRLIRMWIAEGFITSDMCQQEETMEDVARDYLEDLIDRCVVQIARKSYMGNVSFIQVHDLVRDLCMKKAKTHNFLETFTSESSDLPTRLTKVTELRRTAVYSYDKMCLPSLVQNDHLRSLLLHGYQGPDRACTTTASLQLLYKNFRLLRVLILEYIEICDGKLTEEIGSLIHLRYLFVGWYCNIRELPSSIGNLRNLLTLDCRRLPDTTGIRVRIPDDIWKIEGLRHLSLPFNNFIEGGNSQLHTLKHLQTLWGIRGGEWMLEELPRLSQSVKKLCIFDISSKEQLEAAFQCPSISSDCLQSLALEWGVSLPQGEVLMLENLQPIIHCKHLRKLSLRGRIENKLTDCIQFPTSIMKLVLDRTGFEGEAELAALGKLPNLIFLELVIRAYRGAKWTCIAGEFSQLKELRLDLLTELEEWSIERGAMPLLNKLRIQSCNRLRRLPEGLKFIATLQELQLRFMSTEFKKRINGGDDGGGEDAHIVQHVPLVCVY